MEQTCHIYSYLFYKIMSNVHVSIFSYGMVPFIKQAGFALILQNCKKNVNLYTL